MVDKEFLFLQFLTELNNGGQVEQMAVKRGVGV
jgi:hypothetical protein